MVTIVVQRKFNWTWSFLRNHYILYCFYKICWKVYLVFSVSFAQSLCWINVYINRYAKNVFEGFVLLWIPPPPSSIKWNLTMDHTHECYYWCMRDEIYAVIGYSSNVCRIKWIKNINTTSNDMGKVSVH